MANTYSALKRVRQAERRTEVNRQNKTRLRHQIRAMRRALATKDPKVAAELLPKTVSLIDRSAKIGVIKMNTDKTKNKDCSYLCSSVFIRG